MITARRGRGEEKKKNDNDNADYKEEVRMDLLRRGKKLSRPFKDGNDSTRPVTISMYAHRLEKIRDGYPREFRPTDSL